MPETFNLSQNFAIELITADLLMVESGKDPLLSLLPPISKNESLVKWDQPENGYGLLSLRGLNAEPNVTKVPSFRQYSMAPGYYGEKTIIDEHQLTTQREYGTPNEVMDPDFLLSQAIMALSMRTVDQIRNIISTLLRSGRFLVRSANGAITHADQIDGYNLLTPSTTWANPTGAIPLDDMLGWQVTLQTGTSSKFMENSVLLANSFTINELFQTSQLRDKFRLNYGQSPMGLDGVNNILNAYGLPKIVRYDEGYYATEAAAKARLASGFTKFLPNRSLIWAGKRPEGVPAGNFVLTRNLVGKPPVGGAPNYSYDNGKIKGSNLAENIYTTLDYLNKAPVRMELDIGFNGGPAVRFPSAFAGIVYAG